MTLNISDLRQQADTRLQNAVYNPKKLVLIHTAIGLGASLAVTLIGFLISLEIANTGGLGGMGTRSILETIQVVLELAVMVLMPFWNIGLIRAVLCWAKNQRAYPSDLAEGFRRFGTVLAEKCLVGVLFLLVGFLASQIGSTLFMLSPFSASLMEKISEISATSDPNALMTDAFLAEFFQEMIPALIISGILFAVLAIPMYYRIYFADYAVMEGARALESLLISFKITYKRRWQIFKLDLSFWWFYLLQGLTVVLCYGDAILGWMGITLPMSADASFFLFYLLGSVAQCLLLWQYQAKVSATYGMAYETLNPTPAEEKSKVEA